jgi:phage/plasmid-like protein (TIGR03299 family)
MPANVETMAYVGQIPWHGIGNVVTGKESARDVMIAAGLDWTVSKRPLLTIISACEFVPIFGKAAIRRDSDESILGVCGKDWNPLQNTDAFSFFDPFINENQAEYHTAGSLDNGKKVWVLAKVKNADTEIVRNDPVESYIMLSNAHDGVTSVRIGFTPIRVVCANTLALAHSDKSSKLIRVRHSKDVKVNVESIRETMDAVRKTFVANAAQMKKLAKREINAEDVRKYIQQVLETEEETRTFREILGNYHHGIGSDIKGVRGTLWGAYNAVTEFMTHSAGHTDNGRFSSLWFGVNARKNDRALSIALKW